MVGAREDWFGDDTGDCPTSELDFRYMRNLNELVLVDELVSNFYVIEDDPDLILLDSLVSLEGSGTGGTLVPGY